MSKNIYDPSDIENNINGFNIIECSSFQSVDIYICIPNLGYGFISNVLNSFTEKFARIYPGENYSVSRDELKNDNTLKNDKFIPIGSGVTEDYMVIRIPGNNVCSKDIELSEPMVLPIAVKVRNTASTNPDVLSLDVIGDRNLASYAMMTNLVAEDYSSSEQPTDMVLGKAISAEVIRSMSAAGIKTTKNSQFRFTGNSGTTGERVEFVHLTTSSSSKNNGKSYFEIVSDSNIAEYSECFIKPAVYTAFEISAGKKRLIYSDRLSKMILPKFKITGKTLPPTVSISKGTSFLGVPSEQHANVIPTTSANLIPPESVSSFTGFGAYEYILSGSMIGKESAYGAFNDTPVSGIQVVNPSTGLEEEVTITLYTPTPPLFTDGEVYSDSPTGDSEIFVPFTQAYVLPFGSYSRAASDIPEECSFCGKTGKVGISACPVCGGSGSLQCPRCISNIEEVGGVYSLVHGYISTECPVCKTKESAEYAWGTFENYGLGKYMNQKPGYEPCECSKFALKEYMASQDPATFITYMGNAGKTSATCKSCGGSGIVPCTGCNDPGFTNPAPGIRRAKCELCNDTTSDNYLGHPTPKPGELLCTDASLDVMFENKKCMEEYNYHITLNTQTCGGTGSITQETCPACNGSKSSYRFRSIDLDTTVETPGFDGDTGVSYTIVDNDVITHSISSHGIDFKLYSMPPRIKVPIDIKDSAISNISVYYKIPEYSMRGLPISSRWKTDTVFADKNETVLKWLSPLYYDISDRELVLFTDLPSGSEIRIYSFASHNLNGTDTTQGYRLLNERTAYPAIEEDTVYDGTWCYFNNPAGIPIYSFIGTIPSSEIDGLTYNSKSTDNMYMLNNGFTHLVNSTNTYMDIINTQRDKSLPYIMTSGYNETISADFKSRFICIDKTNPGISDILTFVNISEYTNLPYHMRISQDSIEKSITEFKSPQVKPFGGYIKDITRYTKVDDDDVATIVSSLNSLRNTKSVELATSNIYPYVSKSTAGSIKSNSTSDDITVDKGSPVSIVNVESLPSGVELGNSVSMMGGTNKVRITNDSFMNITDIIESSATISGTKLFEDIDTLISSIDNIGRQTLSMIQESAFRGNINDNMDLTITSHNLKFSPAMATFIKYESYLTPTIEELNNFMAASDTVDKTKFDSFKEMITLLKEGEIRDTPADFEQTAAWSLSFMYLRILGLSTIISSLHKTLENGSNQFIAYVTDYDGYTGLATISFTEEASHKGLLVYNMKKTYLLMKSSLNLMVSIIERLMMVILSIMNTIKPGSEIMETKDMNLLIHGFMSSGKLCFPEVSETIDLSSGLLVSQAKLNHITKFVDTGKISYSFEVTIPENSSSDGYTIPILGMGVSDTTAALFGTAEEHMYPFTMGSNSEGYDAYLPGYSGDNPKTFEGDAETEEPEVYRDIEKISEVDYMVYGTNSIRYLSNGVVTTAPITIATLEQELKNSNTYTVPKITSMKATGKIDMGYIFPYSSEGFMFNPPNIQINNQFIAFNESHPRTTMDEIKAIFFKTNPPITGSKDTGNDVFLDNTNYDANMNIVKEGVQKLIQLISTPYVVNRLYRSFSSDTSFTYKIYFMGMTSNTLSHEYRHGESALMNKVFDSIGISVPSRTETDIALEMMDRENYLWKSHTYSEDDLNTSQDMKRVKKDRNFNLWLSKRLSYNLFTLYMSVLKYRHLESSNDHNNETLLKTAVSDADPILFEKNNIQYCSMDGSYKTSYNVSIVYSSTIPSVDQNSIVFQPFHCYGFGSLFQIVNDDDFSSTSIDRPEAVRKRAAQRRVYVLGSENFSGDVSQLFSINHCDVNRQFPIGNDIDPSPNCNIDPVGSFRGGWYNPNVESLEQSAQWNTNVTTLENYLGDDLNTRTRNHVALMLSQSKDNRGNYSTLVTDSSNQIDTCESFFKDIRNSKTLDELISSYIKTPHGLASFSVPEGNLTSNIWMIISKTN